MKRTDSTMISYEQEPVYPGGLREMMGDLSNYLSSHYPKEAKRLDIEGRVLVQFVVERDGSIKDVLVKEGKELGGGLAETAMAAVRTLKRFKPGLQNGSPVRVFYTVPITFRLEGTGFHIASREDPYPTIGRNDSIFFDVETKPEYPGGENALLSDLNRFLASHYPEGARRNGVEGTVVARFTIEEDGHVGNIKVLRGDQLGFSLADAAVAAIRTLKKFTPGIQNGHPARVFMVIPVHFKLGIPAR